MKPFKSEAQRQKILQMVKDGKITMDTYSKMTYETMKRGLPLPARLKPRPTEKKK